MWRMKESFGAYVMEHVAGGIFPEFLALSPRNAQTIEPTTAYCNAKNHIVVLIIYKYFN